MSLPTTDWTKQTGPGDVSDFQAIDGPFDEIAVPFDQLLGSSATSWTQELP